MSDLVGRLALLLAKATDPEDRATLQDAIAVAALQAASEARDAAKIETRREAACARTQRWRERKRDAGDAKYASQASPGVTNVTEPSPEVAHKTRALGLAVQEQEQEQEQEHGLEPAKAVSSLRDSPSLAPTPEASVAPTPVLTLAPSPKRPKRRQPQGQGATEQTPKVPAALLDHLQGVWSEVGGVIPVPRFRKAIAPALASGFTVGQVERAMRWWAGERSETGRAIAIEWFVGELGAVVGRCDRGGIVFVANPADLGLTADEAAAKQAEYLARLRERDLADQAAIILAAAHARASPAPVPDAPDSATDPPTLRLF